MENKIVKLKQILKKEKQEQLLTNFDNLNDAKKEILLNQILHIDFNQMKQLYEGIGKNNKNDDVKIEAIPYLEKAKIDVQTYFEKGEEIIKQGKLTIVTMAGGQGTRLRT